MSELSPPPGTLLLCLDLQAPFLGAIPESERMVRRCEFALRAVTGLGLPAAFTEQVPEKLGRTEAALLAAAPQAAVFAKATFSALADEAIRRALLRERRIEHLLLAGLETPICVYQTAIDAIAAGLQVTLLSDCLGARRASDAAACLDSLTRAGVHVLPAETVFYAMVHDVKHPFFKAYTQLVKSHG